VTVKLHEIKHVGDGSRVAMLRVLDEIREGVESGEVTGFAGVMVNGAMLTGEQFEISFFHPGLISIEAVYLIEHARFEWTIGDDV